MFSFRLGFAAVDRQSVKSEMYVGGQTARQIGVPDVVGNVGQIRSSGFDLVDLLERLIDGQVRGVMSISQGIDHQHIQVGKQRIGVGRER